MSSSARSKKPVIALHDLSLERGGVRILDHINWKVYPGERAR